MADITYIQEMYDWIVKSKEWVFSGCGVAIIVGFCGWLFCKNKNSGQAAKAGDGAIVIQSGRDSNIGDINARRK